MHSWSKVIEMVCVCVCVCVWGGGGVLVECNATDCLMPHSPVRKLQYKAHNITITAPLFSLATRADDVLSVQTGCVRYAINHLTKRTEHLDGQSFYGPTLSPADIKHIYTTLLGDQDVKRLSNHQTQNILDQISSDNLGGIIFHNSI